jgi:hypothetical protein
VARTLCALCVCGVENRLDALPRAASSEGCVPPFFSILPGCHHSDRYLAFNATGFFTTHTTSIVPPNLTSLSSSAASWPGAIKWTRAFLSIKPCAHERRRTPCPIPARTQSAQRPWSIPVRHCSTIHLVPIAAVSSAMNVATPYRRPIKVRVAS